MNIVQVYKLFPTEGDCIAHLEQIRWHDSPICPYCGSYRNTSVPSEQRHHCNNCNTTFSVTVGTLFHRTHLPLQKWFLAISLILHAKKSIAVRQLGKDLEVTKNTAWYLAMRIRIAMNKSSEKEFLERLVKIKDDTYIGSNSSKCKQNEQAKLKHSHGPTNPFVGISEGGGKYKIVIC